MNVVIGWKQVVTVIMIVIAFISLIRLVIPSLFNRLLYVSFIYHINMSWLTVLTDSVLSNVCVETSCTLLNVGQHGFHSRKPRTISSMAYF